MNDRPIEEIVEIILAMRGVNNKTRSDTWYAPSKKVKKNNHQMT